MTITLKNVSVKTHRRLKKQAELHKRSLNQEAIMRLEGTLEVKTDDRQALIARIIKRRNQMAAEGFVAMTQDELRAAIDEGRE